MDPNEILTKILRRYGVLTDNIRAAQIVESKIRKGIATYADAEDMSIRIGKALTEALKENLPEALTDGKLYRAVAEVVLEQPMKTAGRDVAKIAAAIQKQLNEKAGIGMNAIVPEMNQDQIDGIITGICNADSYEAGKSTMFAQVENALEGYVDDFVRENADFQYKAGLSPTIERKATGKCCEWCERLAGSYPYEDVSDRGNDVFRRHKFCHCMILYNPGNGSKRRQNVSTKRWTEIKEPAKMEERQNLMKLDLQMFAHKTGDYRRMQWGHNWQEASLKESIQKFARGAKPVKGPRGKTYYTSKDGKYYIVYDRKGDYFRIVDKVAEENNEPKPCLDLNGNRVMNEFYEMLTHFINSDRKGAKP